MDQVEFESFLEQYSYEFPRDAIANTPAVPRDAARLMRYSRGLDHVSHHTFRDLPNLLSPTSVLVLNDTKVIPARVMCARTTGGSVELLYLRTEGEYEIALSNSKLKAGEKLVVDGVPSFEIVERDGRQWRLKFVQSGPILSFLETYGTTPIPPYIKKSPLQEQELRQEYQTVFAVQQGSIAAPTASLHFTEDLLWRLKERGIDMVYVTLHVGLGTFAPLTPYALEAGVLHEEWYSISEEAADQINEARAGGRPIIGVGTTVVRALESSADEGGIIRPGSHTTNLFIHPGYSFTAVDGMITNFHVPKSSLLMLVAAFVGREKILQIYRDAIARGYRLFSFGDAMLIQ